MRRLALALLAAALLNQPARAQEARPFGDGSWNAILRAHIPRAQAGHPLIVHFWGLSCGPCRIEMAAWGKLLAARRDIDFVTVDTDGVAGAPGQAAAFLAGAGVPVGEAWRFADAFAEKLYFQVDPRWQGEIPTTVLVGRDGQTRRLTGAADMGAVATWLDEQGKKP